MLTTLTLLYHTSSIFIFVLSMSFFRYREREAEDLGELSGTDMSISSGEEAPNREDVVAVSGEGRGKSTDI